MEITVDPIFLTTSILKRFTGTSALGTATGFFFIKDEKVYLVTNKHVIYGNFFSGEDAKPEIDKLMVTLHTDSKDLRKNESVEVKLLGGKKTLWLEHENKNIDLVCIPVDLDRTKYHFVTIADDVIDTENLKIGFEKVFIMGYPFGWFDSLHNLPVTRIGHLSSPFGVPFNGEPLLLADVETHMGMSGSPVFMHLKDYVNIAEDGGLVTNLGASKTILLGVFSGQPLWQVPDTITNDIKSIPHSLSRIWFASLIREIIGQ
jgi:hypothetical protein